MTSSKSTSEHPFSMLSILLRAVDDAWFVNTANHQLPVTFVPRTDAAQPANVQVPVAYYPNDVPGQVTYLRDIVIANDELQRRVDAAVRAEFEAWAGTQGRKAHARRGLAWAGIALGILLALALGFSLAVMLHVAH